MSDVVEKAKADKTFIGIHETIIQSLISDAGTFALFVGLIGVGKWIGSPAMEWTGAVIGFLTLMVHGAKLRKPMTRDQAMKFLAEIDEDD